VTAIAATALAGCRLSDGTAIRPPTWSASRSGSPSTASTSVATWVDEAATGCSMRGTSPRARSARGAGDVLRVDDRRRVRDLQARPRRRRRPGGRARGTFRRDEHLPRRRGGHHHDRPWSTRGTSDDPDRHCVEKAGVIKPGMVVVTGERQRAEADAVSARRWPTVAPRSCRHSTACATRCRLRAGARSSPRHARRPLRPARPGPSRAATRPTTPISRCGCSSRWLLRPLGAHAASSAHSWLPPGRVVSS